MMLTCLLVAALLPVAAQAQRPFRPQDPFYRGETARRAFFDGYAFTTEFAWLSADAAAENGQSVDRDPFGLILRLDHSLFDHIDASAIIDASGGSYGRTLSLSWIALKYYRTVDLTDYAIRVAVDPSLDGQVGFPQMDLAFISTSLLSERLSSDVAFGIRRVRRGFEQLVPNEENMPDIPEAPGASDIVYTRALGWEIHGMLQYSVLLNPARNNVFVSVLLDRGQYDLLKTSVARAYSESPDAAYNGGGEMIEATDPDWSSQYRAGALWFRTGIEYNRPEFQITPFVSLPIHQWMPEDVGSKAHINAGVRFMLR